MKWGRKFEDGCLDIKNYERRWTEDEGERSGILNWMIEGLLRLLGNNSFSVSLSQEQAMLEYERSSDSVSAWVRERVVKDKKCRVDQNVAFLDYVDYCDFFGIYQVDESKFKNQLSTKFGLSKKRVHTQQGNVNFLCGIKIKPSIYNDEGKQEDIVQQTLDFKNSIVENNQDVTKNECAQHAHLYRPFSTQKNQSNIDNMFSSCQMPCKPVHVVHNEKSLDLSQEQTVYNYKRVTLGGKCFMCEEFAEEYVIFHSEKTKGFVYPAALKRGNEEHLCSVCFSKKRKAAPLALWVDLSVVAVVDGGEVG